jgi:adenylate cyclase
MSKKGLTLRFTLTTAFTVLIVVASALIFTVSYIGSTRSILLLSQNLTSEVSKSIRAKITDLLTSAEKVNSQIGFLISNRIIDYNDKQRLMDLAARYIANNEGFTSVDIGNVLGNKYKAERLPDNSISRRCYVRDKQHVTMTWYHSNPANNEIFKDKVQDLEKGYDPRQRPWWITAVTNGKTGWSDVYISHTRRQFKYSCAAPIFAKDGKLMAVSTIDINIVTLSEFLGTLHIFEHGRAFILNNRNQVIAISMKSAADLDDLVKKNPRGSKHPFALYQLKEFPDPNIRAAVTTWLNRKASQEDFAFTGADGVSYLADLVDFPYKAGSHFTIGIIFPKDDILGAVKRNSLIVFAIIAVCFLLSVLIGILLSRRISHSLAKLATEVDKVSRLDLDSDAAIRSRISEVVKISDSVLNMKKGLRSFKKYVPADLVRQLNDLHKEAVLGGEKQTLSIFFSDIAGFTTISEQLSAEALVENLGVYFHGMSDTILQNGGTIDKYIGDAIMAFWGAPVERANHASLACATALKCQEYLDRLAPGFTQAGKPLFHTRIGIHTGEVIVGNIGYEERLNYTIIGDSVNLASRLEGLNKYYGTRIIISDETRAQVAGEFVTRRLDLVAVKGKSQGVAIHELAGTRDDLAADGLAAIELYNQALELYLHHQWQEALPLFQEALRQAGGADRASSLMIERCTEYRATPPQNDWNGVYVFQSK